MIYFLSFLLFDNSASKRFSPGGNEEMIINCDNYDISVFNERKRKKSTFLRFQIYPSLLYMFDIEKQIYLFIIKRSQCVSLFLCNN